MRTLKKGEQFCADCSADLEGRAPRTKRCSDCSEKRNNTHHGKRQKKAR